VIDEFTEFVVIDDATAELFLVVAGEDRNQRARQRCLSPEAVAEVR